MKVVSKPVTKGKTNNLGCARMTVTDVVNSRQLRESLSVMEFMVFSVLPSYLTGRPSWSITKQARSWNRRAHCSEVHWRGYRTGTLVSDIQSSPGARTRRLSP